MEASIPSAVKSAFRVTTRLGRPSSGRPIRSYVLRPMTMGLPIVTALKYLRSLDNFHGSPPSRPMMPFSATATISEIRKPSDRDGGQDMRMEAIPIQGEIVVGKSEYIVDRGIQRHRWQRIWIAQQLLVSLLDMIGVKMRIAQCVNEIARLQPVTFMIISVSGASGRDGERHAKKYISAALMADTTVFRPAT